MTDVQYLILTRYIDNKSSIYPFNTCPIGNFVRIKTYIVEDNPTIRDNLIETLEELACIETVGTAETENDSKFWLLHNPSSWTLAIVDLFLKQGSGLGVLASLRERPSRQKVVVLTNYATADIRQRCAQLGVDAVFDKSNEIDALVEFCIQQRDLLQGDLLQNPLLPDKLID